MNPFRFIPKPHHVAMAASNPERQQNACPSGTEPVYDAQLRTVLCKKKAGPPPSTLLFPSLEGQPPAGPGQISVAPSAHGGPQGFPTCAHGNVFTVVDAPCPSGSTLIMSIYKQGETLRACCRGLAQPDPHGPAVPPRPGTGVSPFPTRAPVVTQSIPTRPSGTAAPRPGGGMVRTASVSLQSNPCNRAYRFM